MSPRRAALPLAATALLGIGATGCERPSPAVSLVASGTFVRTRAAQYCFSTDDCRTSSAHAVVRVPSPTQIGIDVPRSLAKEGWAVLEESGGQALRERFEHYYSIGPLRVAPGQQQPITVVRVGPGGTVTARWNFVLIGR